MAGDGNETCPLRPYLLGNENENSYSEKRRLVEFYGKFKNLLAFTEGRKV